MDRLQNIEAFVQVAHTQNFSEAARQMRVSKSVVTTRVKQLEELVGAPLFHRSTRMVRLTEFGQSFLRDCSELVGRANDIVDHMCEVRGTPAGVLRVHALTGFVLGHFASLLRGFQSRYPGIRLDLIVSDAVVDPVKAGVDCALQIFPAASTELISSAVWLSASQVQSNHTLSSTAKSMSSRKKKADDTLHSFLSTDHSSTSELLT